MDNQLTSTTTIGQCLHQICATSGEEKQVLLERFYGLIEGHQEEKLLRVLAEHAKCGDSQANLGRCIPPDLSNDRISIDIIGNYAYASW